MRSGTTYKRYVGLSREACQDKCTSATDMNCQLINYKKDTSDCYLVQKTIAQAKEEYAYRSPFANYDVMVCEEEGKMMIIFAISKTAVILTFLLKYIVTGFVITIVKTNFPIIILNSILFSCFQLYSS